LHREERNRLLQLALQDPQAVIRGQAMVLARKWKVQAGKAEVRRFPFPVDEGFPPSEFVDSE